MRRDFAGGYGILMTFRGSKLVILLLVVTVAAAPLLASLCHHHASSSDNNCPVCHFNHQPMDRPLAEHRLPSFEALREDPAPVETRLIAAQSIRPLPSRAPPSA
ncbi:MAG TPA: hypothetical protein VKG84_12050 [Candidatus Acidoferrales bacterium]|nr:hypothetical protein [Candidatus Acidoferrales bacterium]